MRPADAGDVGHGVSRGGHANATPALAERFVFVTGGAFSGDARRFLEEEVPAVIHKPFRVDDLLRLIDAIAAGGGKRAAPPAPEAAPKRARPRDADRPGARASWWSPR